MYFGHFGHLKVYFMIGNVSGKGFGFCVSGKHAKFMADYFSSWYSPDLQSRIFFRKALRIGGRQRRFRRIADKSVFPDLCYRFTPLDPLFAGITTGHQKHTPDRRAQKNAQHAAIYNLAEILRRMRLCWY